MFYKQIKKLLAEKMPQQSRALIAFKDDSGLVPSNHIKVHPEYINPISRDQSTFSVTLQ